MKESFTPGHFDISAPTAREAGAKLLSFQAAFQGRIGSILEQCGLLTASRARMRAPFRTGRLYSSIGHEVRGRTARVYAETPYAGLVEFARPGDYPVKAHARTINQAFGRRFSPARKVQVREHRWRLGMPGTPPRYLYSSYADSFPDFVGILRGAVEDSKKEAGL